MDCTFNRSIWQFATRLGAHEAHVATVIIESHTYNLIPEAYVSFNSHPYTVSVEAAHAQMEALRRAGYACTVTREALVCDDADHYDLMDEEPLDEGDFPCCAPSLLRGSLAR